MKTLVKLAIAATVGGAVFVSLAAQGDAAPRYRHWYYGPSGSAWAPAYDSYAQGTYVGSGYDAYGYAPGYATGYGGGWNPSALREHRCMLSPGNPNYVPCDSKF